MSTTYPTSIQTLSSTRGATGNPLNSPNHITHHTTEDDTLEALQTKVGVNGSAVNTTHDYKLSGVATGDKAMSLTGAETGTNKTFTNVQLNFSSNATGDTYYRNASGVTSRLAIGTIGQIYSVSSGGIPEWIANPAAADASETEKGVVEIATAAQRTSGATTGETGARLVVSADAIGTTANKVLQLDASAKIPPVDGSQLTNMPGNKIAFALTDTVFTASASNPETDLVTLSVPGGSLSTANAMRLKVFFSAWSNQSGNEASFRFKVKYGSTTVLDFDAKNSAGSNSTGSGVLEAVVFANASATSQVADGIWGYGVDSVGSLTNAPLQTSWFKTGTATENSANTLNLIVTGQWAGNTASGNTITIRHATLEKIY